MAEIAAKNGNYTSFPSYLWPTIKESASLKNTKRSSELFKTLQAAYPTQSRSKPCLAQNLREGPPTKDNGRNYSTRFKCSGSLLPLSLRLLAARPALHSFNAGVAAIQVFHLRPTEKSIPFARI